MNRRSFILATLLAPFSRWLPQAECYDGWGSPTMDAVIDRSYVHLEQLPWPKAKNAYFPTELVKMETEIVNKEFFDAMFSRP